jgi:hypothetical protein
MTYDECVHAALFDFQSWSIAFAGLAIVVFLRKVFSLRRVAAEIFLIALLGSAPWAYGFYEMNCVELYEG